MFQQLYSPLRIGTNKFNIHSSSKIPLVTHDSEEESQVDVSTVSDKECQKVRCASNDSLTTADEIKVPEIE